MTILRERFDEEIDAVKALRDEIEVQLHLGGAEAREQWEKLEKQWHHLEGRLKVIGAETKDVAEDVAGEVGDTLNQLANQLKDGYGRLKKLL